MRKLLALAFLLFPWPIRRWLLVLVFRYQIHPTARIGFSWICPQELQMGAGARIGSLTVCKGLARLTMGESSWIGNLNWITGFSKGEGEFFEGQSERNPELIVGEHSAITNRHLIDCTDSVRIGKFTTFAGFRSQILTHSIELASCKQLAKPVKIGSYCFVGTASVLLSGSALPDYSILGANSILNKEYTETHMLYAGNPARPVKPLNRDMKYFTRSVGFVY